MSEQDNYLFKVIGSIVMGYGIDKPNPETLAIAQKIIDLVEKATEARIIKLLETDAVGYCTCKYGYKETDSGELIEVQEFICEPHRYIALIKGQKDNETVIFLTKNDAEQLANAILEE